MKFRPVAALTVVCLISSLPAVAADKLHMYPIKDALENPTAKKKLSGVSFYFGNQETPTIVEKMGVLTSNPRTYLGKFDTSAPISTSYPNVSGDPAIGWKKACEWAFLSAMISFRKNAISQGGNAVINLKSSYKGNTIVSDTEYECGVGAVLVGVTFTGTVVKLAQ